MKITTLIRNLLLAVLLLLVAALGLHFRADISLDTLKASYANGVSAFVEIEGMPVHYRLEGKGKETLVLLHGTGASLHTWDVWTELLKDKYQILRMDLPAFGLTGPDPQNRYEIKDYVSFLDKLLVKLNVNKFHLGGNSLGGQIAWEYALAYPEKVDKLVLIDAGGIPTDKARPWVFRLAKTPVLNQIVRYVTPRFFFKNNLTQVYADPSKISPELIDRYYELTRREGNRQAFIERAKIESKSDYQALRNLKNPTLIIWGKEDHWIPVKNAQIFSDLLPNDTLIVFDNAGHVPMEEIPETTAQSTFVFLSK